MRVRIHLDKSSRAQSLHIDDVDITAHALAAGFKIECNEFGQPVVHLRLKPDALDLTGDLYAQEAPPTPSVVEQVQPALRTLMALGQTSAKQEYVDRLQAEVDAAVALEESRG